jgi:hypothetical protein
MRSIDFSAMGLGAWFDRRDVRQWDGPAVLLPRQQAKLARGANDKEHAMSQTPNTAIAVIGIDIGKNSFHAVPTANQTRAYW